MARRASEPAAPIGQGWLRVSQRKLDPARSKPWQPRHSHDERQLLEPGRIYEVDVEIWPGQTLLPAGYSLALRIEGKDFVRPRPGILGWVKDRILGDLLGINVMAGSGLFLHNHPDDRPEDVFGGRDTIHTGGEHPSFLMIPVVPASRPGAGARAAGARRPGAKPESAARAGPEPAWISLAVDSHLRHPHFSACNPTGGHP